MGAAGFRALLQLAVTSVPVPAPLADFNATLPVMMGEFLLLMVFLDKFWFGPVGKVLDERDSSLRGKLALVKDNGAEVGGCCSSWLTRGSQLWIRSLVDLFA